jgi:DNA repair protein RadA
MPDDFEELAGVGAKAAEALREAGYLDFMAVAAASAANISEACGIGQKTAEKIILEARKRMRMGFESADKVLKKREKVGKITTGSEALDELLGGGVETQSITEAHGAFGSGKTQLGFQLAVNVQLPKGEGGLGGKCVYIDTEGTFRPDRIQNMAEARGMDAENALKNVFVGRAFNSDHQILLTEEAKGMVSEKNIKLIIVDSLTAMFRTDYMGRGELAPRQQRLNRHIHTLQKLADANNAAIYVTNQVMARPDILFGDPTSAIGGHIVGHAATYRLYLRKSRKDSRIARLIDSPNLPTGEAIFLVKKEGIVDEGTKKKK